VTRPRRSQAADHVRLEDLLSAGVPPPPPVLGRDDQQPWLVGTVLVALLASAVVYVGLSAFGARIAYPLVAAACLGVAAIWQVSRMVSEPPWLVVRDLVRPVEVPRRRQPRAAYEGGDGMAAAMRRWNRLLEWGVTGVVTDPGRFARTVGTPLGELVDERLRQRHGITRATDPARARAILGENLWTLLGPQHRVPSPREVAAAVAELERI
jgi:hypothetical protein